MTEAQPRVRVTSSRRGAPASRRRPVSVDIAENTEIGELYVEGLIRAQFRLSLFAMVSGAVSVLALLLLFFVIPATRTLTVAGLPVSWLVLGVLLYPAAVALGWWYLRTAAGLERSFQRAIGDA